MPAISEIHANWFHLIQAIFILIQIGVILWVARQWKNQKRSEKYADQCHRILQYWHNIEHYWYILTGQAVYYVNERDHSKKFFEENGDSVLCFLTFLRNPEIYVNKKDKESMDMIKKIKRIHIDIKFLFDNWFGKHSDNLNGPGLYGFIEKSLYEKSLTEIPEEYEDIKEEIENIKNSSEQEEGIKRLDIHKVYNKKYNEDIKKLKNILLNYAHYKK